MPIHDWTRVDANLFHDFHQTWTIGIRNALNSGLLPEGYFALVEQHAGGVVPDVIALEERRGATPGNPPKGGTVLMEPPKTRYVLRADNESQVARANRIAIHHPLGDVISIIEIVSPGNKSGQSALRAFVEKTVAFLKNGINVLVVDLFPPSPRDPQGIHPVIWDEIDPQPFELPPDKALTLASYVAGIPKVARVEPVAVGDLLPDMPAYLDPDRYVPVPLEATYQATWGSCPKAMRDAVERGSPSVTQ
jgi:hypothetical protein